MSLPSPLVPLDPKWFPWIGFVILWAHQFLPENYPPNGHPHTDTIIGIMVNIELLESEQIAQPCGVFCTEKVSEDSRSEKCLYHVSVNPELPWFRIRYLLGSFFITLTTSPVFIHIKSLIISISQTYQFHVWAFIPRKQSQMLSKISFRFRISYR